MQKEGRGSESFYLIYKYLYSFFQNMPKHVIEFTFRTSADGFGNN